jgi:arginyl-tRNA synthetase
MMLEEGYGAETSASLAAADRIRQQQEISLEHFHVRFDRWFRESELYDNGRVDAGFDTLVNRHLTYEFLRNHNIPPSKMRQADRGPGEF